MRKDCCCCCCCCCCKVITLLYCFDNNWDCKKKNTMKKIIAPSINSVGQCNNLNRSLATRAHQAQAKRSQSPSKDGSIDRGATPTTVCATNTESKK